MREHATNLWGKAAAIRKALRFHRTWLAKHLGAPISDCAILESDVDLTQIGNEYVIGSNAQKDAPTRTLQRLRALVANAEAPRHFPPIVECTTQNPPEQYSDIMVDGIPPHQPGIYWGDAPLVLRLHAGGMVLVALNVPYFAGPVASYESTAHIVVVRRDRAPEILHLIADIARRDQQPRIQIQDGPTRPVANLEWQDLVLDQTVLTLLRDDFESFFERGEWYRRNRLPYRRGYLFHGEPGNGKSSAVRAMLTSRGLTAYTLRFFDPRTDDSDLDRLVDCAVRNRPSLLLLEDVDRVFPKTGDSKSNVSLQHLLNCLDGVGTSDGVIVVATCNEPTLLDGAILRRPGRFDRVVHFARPASELRMRYLLKFNQGIDARALEQPVAESDGFSYAQLREAVILGGQRAFEHTRDVDADDLLYAIRILRQTTAQGSKHTRSAGFVPGGDGEKVY